MQWNSPAKNDWSQSTLYSYLNTTYYNGINATYKNMIENARWIIGGWNTTNVSTSQMYEYERNTTGGDSTTLVATGYIGLMRASDYGYASSGCYLGQSYLFNYGATKCTSTSWLHGFTEWTITPAGATAYVSLVRYNVGVRDNFATGEYAVRPSLYLKSNVYITGGTGTSGDPYILGM